MNARDKIRPGTVFRLSKPLEQLPEDLRMRNVEWGVLFAVTGRHTVAQIGGHFSLSEGERDRAFERLAASGLIEEREVTVSEYLRAAATIGDDEPKSLARFLRSGAALGMRRSKPGSPRVDVRAPASGVPAKPPAERQIDPETVTREISVPLAGEAMAAGAFQPLTAPAPRPERKLSLRKVMKFIIDRAPDRNAGQLDIYRVFIRVNSKLLKRNGIDTLRFEDDRIVGDPELQSAITASVERTLGLSCPQDVYV